MPTNERKKKELKRIAQCQNQTKLPFLTNKKRSRTEEQTTPHEKEKQTENDQCSNHINTQDPCDDSISSDNSIFYTKNSNEEITAGELDIGDFVNTNLDDATKYKLLTNHFKPDHTYKFPSREQHGCNRALKHHWLTSYSFLVYSKKYDSVYCLPCTLFDKAEISQRSIFAKNTGFSSWFKIKEKLLEHINCEGIDAEKNKTCKHSRMMADAEDLIQRFKKPSMTIPYSFDDTKESRVSKNREILKWVIKTIILCGKQCIALRGHREDINSNNNCGNFLAILKLLSETNSELKDHLDAPSAKNATYISPGIQNELIHIISYDVLQKQLIDEVKEAKFFSIMADEVESHHTEQLPICVRFVDKECNIREEFLEFGKCVQTNGESIFKELMRIIEKAGLDIELCRGQGYDGASNMSSETVGVQQRIKELCEKAVYTHCCGHNLSLVVVSACKISVVYNMLDTVKETSRLFVKGSKKMNLLKDVVKQNPHYAKGQKVMFDLCVTRWVENLDGYNRFSVSLPFIIETLEVIGYKLHLEKYPDWKEWDMESRRRATSLLGALTSFKFIITLIVTVRALFFMRGITEKMQGRSLDIYDVVLQVNIVRDDLVYERRHAETSLFQRCYDQACALAELVDVEPTMPRLASRQTHRANAESNSPFQYYLRNVCYPLLDHLINGIDVRFDKYGKTIHLMYGLIPSVTAEREVDIKDIIEQYKDDLPMPDNTMEEFFRWKRRWSSVSKNDRPSTIAAALKACDCDMYPNLHVLLRICATIPVTSCECERSGSVLKRLNTYLRASMGQTRLSALAFLHINYDVNIDIDHVINVFAAKKERALEFVNICDKNIV